VSTAVAVSRSRRSLAGPITCAGGLLAAGTYVAAVDPNAAGTTLAPCPLHALTGLWCPACGMTRAVHALAHARVADAFGYNLLFPFFLGAIALAWLAWLRRALGRGPIRWLIASPRWTGAAVIVVLVAFGVLRNLRPFAALAP
jgi:hypothetical protein